MHGRYGMWAVIGGVAFLLILGSAVWFGPIGGTMMRGGYYGTWSGMMGGGYSWMGIGMILFGFLCLAGLYFVFSGVRPGGHYRGDGALAIARERYARGEITSEEYERIRKNLE